MVLVVVFEIVAEIEKTFRFCYGLTVNTTRTLFDSSTNDFLGYTNMILQNNIKLLNNVQVTRAFHYHTFIDDMSVIDEGLRWLALK